MFWKFWYTLCGSKRCPHVIFQVCKKCEGRRDNSKSDWYAIIVFAVCSDWYLLLFNFKVHYWWNRNRAMSHVTFFDAYIALFKTGVGMSIFTQVFWNDAIRIKFLYIICVCYNCMCNMYIFSSHDQSCEGRYFCHILLLSFWCGFIFSWFTWYVSVLIINKCIMIIPCSATKQQ